MKQVSLHTPIPLYYVGPDLAEGPLPAIFYFALSAKESLLTSPFNQPVVYWSQSPCRIFSVDLPFHGEHFSSVDGMKHWAAAWETGDPFLEIFLQQLKTSLSLLLEQGCISSLAVSGLSRGGFIAYHLASYYPLMNTIATFAPLTDLGYIKEMKSLKNSSFLAAHSLFSLTESLAKKTSKAYIGNHDTRVGTDACFHWIHTLAQTASALHIRSAPIELVIKPSIGHQGHGTSKESFEEGALWVLQNM